MTVQLFPITLAGSAFAPIAAGPVQANLGLVWPTRIFVVFLPLAVRAYRQRPD